MNPILEASMTVEQLYAPSIQPLPVAERLRLAALILEGIPPEAVADYRDEWSEEDLGDFSRSSALPWFQRPGASWPDKLLQEIRRWETQFRCSALSR